MITRSIKYLLIVSTNLILLTVLLLIWTDSLELTFNNWVRPLEFLKIIGFTILSLTGIRILIVYFRKFNVESVTKRIKMSVLLTMLISSYLYYDYFSKALENRVLNGELRKGILSKIEPANSLANGTKAENLSLREYNVITQINWFPILPDKASNIEYIYEFDGFLPDYWFSLSYDLPLESEVEEIDFQNSNYSKRQIFEIKNNKKRVTYSEGVQ